MELDILSISFEPFFHTELNFQVPIKSSYSIPLQSFLEILSKFFISVNGGNFFVSRVILNIIFYSS